MRNSQNIWHIEIPRRAVRKNLYKNMMGANLDFSMEKFSLNRFTFRQIYPINNAFLRHGCNLEVSVIPRRNLIVVLWWLGHILVTHKVSVHGHVLHLAISGSRVRANTHPFHLIYWYPIISYKISFTYIFKAL